MKKLMSSALGLAFLLVSGWASAVMVDAFDYTLEGGWLVGSGICESGADCLTYGGDTSIPGQASMITWGTGVAAGGFQRSSITSWQNDDDNSEALGDLTGGGQILGDGTKRVGTIFTHNNNIVANDDELLVQVDFAETFTLTGPAGLTFSNNPSIALFGVAFFETPNTTLGNCPTAQSSTTPCDDFFVILNEEDLFQTNEVCSESDPTDCWDYLFTISQRDLVTVSVDDLAQFGITLSDDQKDIAGLTVGVLITEEGQANTFAFEIMTMHVVPEPQTLALMGLGLLGLGLSRRRRIAA